MTTHESADIILRLYDMRRESVMRQARNWFVRDFNPTSAQAVIDTMMQGEHGAWLRQVLSYWEMACALVNHGSVDRGLFLECNQEHVLVFAKIEPHLAEIRKAMNPSFARNLEAVVRAMPGIDEQLKRMRERFSAMAATARR